tara:strand:- start:42 stop:248 length:207 start_codon:yes stop_codon:yes gene_type:complete
MKGNDMNCLRTIKGKACTGNLEKFYNQYYSYETYEFIGRKYYRCVTCRRLPLKSQQDMYGLNEKGEIL